MHFCEARGDTRLFQKHRTLAEYDVYCIGHVQPMVTKI